MHVIRDSSGNEYPICVEDTLEGEGIYTYWRNEILVQIFKGKIYNGKKTGCLHIGNFNSYNRLQGHGAVYSLQDNIVLRMFQGNFRDGKRDGQGVSSMFKNGNLTYEYDGNYMDNRKNGIGILRTFHDNEKTIYSGRWENGKFSGNNNNVTFIKENKKVKSFCGIFYNGLKNGMGHAKLYYPDGITVKTQFDGGFCDGIRNGPGTQKTYNLDGSVKSVLIGIWESNELQPILQPLDNYQ